jgi:hypothetical protein
MPNCWDSAKIEKGGVSDEGSTLIRVGLGENDFTLTDSDSFRPKKLKRIKPEPVDPAVYDRLSRWVQQQMALLVHFHRGFHLIVRILRAHEFSKGRFILLDEKTLDFHVIQLDRCLRVISGEEEGLHSFHTITVRGADQIIEIAEIRGTPEDALRLSALGSKLVH